MLGCVIVLACMSHRQAVFAQRLDELHGPLVRVTQRLQRFSLGFESCAVASLKLV